MGDRRMLTKKVTDDDHFMSLSSSAQALYLHLSMSADDDGFCNQVSLCMFKAHASVQDLEALLSLRYIYQFESGVIVIKHWRMANALRKDRYTPTVWQKEFAMLHIKENGAYTLSDGCQAVANRLPTGFHNISKDNLSKDNTSKDNVYAHPEGSQDTQFDSFWSIYPKKKSKGTARKAFDKALKKTTFDTIMDKLALLKNTLEWTKQDGEFVPYPATWLNAEGWNDEVRDGNDNLKRLYEMTLEDEDDKE